MMIDEVLTIRDPMIAASRSQSCDVPVVNTSPITNRQSAM